MKNLVTIVCATSPHRFGSDTIMLELIHRIILSSQFNECKFIICADGLNPKSDFQNKQEEYKEYLQNIRLNIKGCELICSDKHIGLTLNYQQAWDSNKIKTPFVLLLNHDTIFTDKLLSVDVENLLMNFPSFVNILMFPRISEEGINKDWWRNVNMDNHPEYVANQYWEDCRISFGNQDNCCLIKTDFFKNLVSRFYNPEVTHFIEDSIQDYLINLNTKDLDGWSQFSGCMYKESNNIHLDGQSKAGNWRQDNCRGGEIVWSNGSLRSNDQSMLKIFFKKDEQIKTLYYRYLGKVLEDCQQKCLSKFQELKSLCEKSLSLKKTLSGKNYNSTKVNLLKSFLPAQEDKFLFHLKLEPFRAEIHWEDRRDNIPDNSNIIMKLFKLNDDKSYSMLRNGGHPKNCYKFLFGDLNITPSDILKIELKEFLGPHATDKPPEVFKNFNFAFCEFSEDKISFFMDRLFGEENVKLNIRKNNGSKINFTQENQVYEVKHEDMDDCDSLVGFFYIQDKEGRNFQSWSFECNPFGVDFTPIKTLQEGYQNFQSVLINE